MNKNVFSRNPVFLFLLLFFTSCSLRDLAVINPSTWFPEMKNGEGTSALPLDTHENILENMIIAYNTRDIQLYEKILSDDYRFYMSLSLYGMYNGENRTPDPSVWNSEMVQENNLDVVKYFMGKQADVASIRNLFSPTGSVSDVSLFFNHSLINLSGDTAVYTVRNISLNITQRNPFRLLFVDDGNSTVPTIVNIVRNESTGEWKISRWFDNTSSFFDKDD